MFTQRQKMLDAIELSYVKNKTPYPDRIQSLANLLAPNHSKITNKDITTAVSEFLMNCSYKIWLTPGPESTSFQTLWKMKTGEKFWDEKVISKQRPVSFEKDDY